MSHASHKNEDFRKYREIAPPSVGDDKIHELIEKHAGSVEAIQSAIDHMWNSKFCFLVGLKVENWTMILCLIAFLLVYSCVLMHSYAKHCLLCCR